MTENLLNYEWSALSQLIYRMNRCKDYEEFSKTILEQIHTVVPFSQGLIFKAKRQNQGVVLSNSLCLPESENAQYYIDKFLNGNYTPKWVSYLNSPWSSVFRFSNITVENSWSNSSIYQDILQPQGLYYAIYMTFVHHDQALGAIAIWRKKNERDFTEKELFKLEMLKIHIELKFFYLLNFEVIPKTQLPGTKRTITGEFAENYNLTKRELEIIQLVSNGKGNEDICSLLYISDSTLRKHIHNIYQKVGIKNRVQLLQKMKDFRL